MAGCLGTQCNQQLWAARCSSTCMHGPGAARHLAANEPLPCAARSAARILGAWEPLLGEALGRWGEEPAALKALFEQYRSARMKERHSEWVALNPLYPGVADALQVPRTLFDRLAIEKVLTWCGTWQQVCAQQPIILFLASNS